MNRSMDILFNALTNNNNLESLLSDPDTYFAKENISQEEINKILAIIDVSLRISKEREHQEQFLREQQKSTADTAHAFKSGLMNPLTQIESGFRSSMFMYKVAFYLGVCLIIISIVYA